MSDVVQGNGVEPAADTVEIEERREDRKLKRWIVQVVTLGFMFVFVASILSLIYAAVVQEKDLNTSFIGEMFKLVFDFLRFLMS